MKTAVASLCGLVFLFLPATGTPQTQTNLPFWRGVLVRFDPKSGELQLTTPEGERTCYLTPRTYVFRGEQKLSADKLKPGDYLKLRVAGSPTGTITVIRVKVDTNTVPLPPLTLP